MLWILFNRCPTHINAFPSLNLFVFPFHRNMNPFLRSVLNFVSNPGSSISYRTDRSTDSPSHGIFSFSYSLSFIIFLFIIFLILWSMESSQAWSVLSLFNIHYLLFPRLGWYRRFLKDKELWIVFENLWSREWFLFSWVSYSNNQLLVSSVDQRLDLFLKVLRVLCPNLTDDSWSMKI